MISEKDINRFDVLMKELSLNDKLKEALELYIKITVDEISKFSKDDLNFRYNQLNGVVLFKNFMFDVFEK